MEKAFEYPVEALRVPGVRWRLYASVRGVAVLLANAIRLGLLLCCLGVTTASVAAEPARVLLLTGADPSQPAVFVQIRAIRSVLDAEMPGGAEVYLDSIDGFRFGDEDLTQEFLALMQKKYKGQRIDLIVVLGTHAADFVLQHRAKLWPGTPVLFSSVAENWMVGRTLPPEIAVMPFGTDVGKTLALARTLQPRAHRLVVVGGVTDVDTEMIDRVIRTANREPGRWTTVERWEGLGLGEMEKRLAGLGKDDVVIYTTVYRDKEGHRYFPYQLLPSMVRASHAPIYGWYSTYIEGGITAGVVYDLAENGTNTGKTAVAILRNGGKFTNVALPPMPSHCVANVAEFERFGLSVASLPADCQLVNFPPSIFREYRGTMLTLLAVVIAQALTIVALLAQRRKRRDAEAEAAARSNELARAARFAAAGELSASIAHEVGQPLGAILSNADAAELIVTSQHADVGELQEILSDVKRDALRANDVVQRLRALLQKQSIVFSPIPVDATLKDSLPLLEPEARRRAIRIDAQFAAEDLEVMGDHVQLQQVLLNLAVNAMDAMHDSAPADRVLTLVTRQVGKGVEIAVSDRGSGFRVSCPEQLFEPFYTTKPHGMGLGLSIVRSIVEAHDGRVRAALRGGGGAEIVVWLPLVEGNHHTPPEGDVSDTPAPMDGVAR
ncbi:Adaptive-response sensory-kinase SasA [Paraburkholderia caffeinitolerans]|uniref:histidine kinase n=1 Tax=Paraburkholderia caffeinitolerans TaxID=1723730 RepID=A0A6J5FVP2_9BURK|nr:MULTISPECIES: HAMP domain-containing sensor histidine kinase [Paraburkholderia]CAB3787793.1 Adaptive-response sensory-kinase SasA [Paraburkholderia caffeinitolerans]